MEEVYALAAELGQDATILHPTLHDKNRARLCDATRRRRGRVRLMSVPKLGVSGVYVYIYIYIPNRVTEVGRPQLLYGEG